MLTSLLKIFVAAAAALTVAGYTFAGDQAPQPGAPASTPVLVRTIPLTGVDGPVDRTGIRGRLDHMACDAKTKRLFVACLANGSLEVVDLEQGKRTKSIAGLKKPQSIGIASDAGIVAVSTGGDGMVHFFDAATMQEKAAVPVGEDADNIRVAPSGRVCVGFGGDTGPGGLAEFNPKTLARTGTIDLPMRPESFQFDASGARLFANQPGAKQATTDGTVVAVDLPSKQVVWKSTLPKAARNFPMAADAARHHLFVACRLPPKLIAMNDLTGAVIAEAACPPDSDDLLLDSKTGCVAVIGGGLRTGDGDDGAGSALEVFAMDPHGALVKKASVPLPPHARTGQFVPERRAIYIAAPPLPSRGSAVLEFAWPLPAANR